MCYIEKRFDPGNALDDNPYFFLMNRKNVIDASERVDVPFSYINDVDTPNTLPSRNSVKKQSEHVHYHIGFMQQK